MIPDFPHNIRIRLDQLNFFLLRPDVALSLPCWLSQFRKAKLRQPTGQRQSNVRTHQKKILIRPILFLCYEESLVLSNLNSKLLRFDCVRPNKYRYKYYFKAQFDWFFQTETWEVIAYHQNKGISIHGDYFFLPRGSWWLCFFSTVVSPTLQLKTDVTNCEGQSTLGVLKY